MKRCITVFVLLISIGSIAQNEIQLYQGKAPGSEDWNWDVKEVNSKLFSDRFLYNVSTPTITAYIPDQFKANGTAVIIAPGGAFHILSIDNEGVEVAKWLNSKGIAAFVLKYRVAKSETEDPIKELLPLLGDFEALNKKTSNVVKLATQDGLQAVKYVRENAKQYNINPEKIGFMGFSAGGTITMSVLYNSNQSNRPNFVAPIYAYEKAIIGNEIPKEKVPIFVAVASDDDFGFQKHAINIYNKWNDAKQPAELHIYQAGKHGFGMHKTKIPTDSWVSRFADWLKQNDFLPNMKPSMSPFQRPITPNDTLHSVQVLNDGRVKFSIYSPDANEVLVQGDYDRTFAPDTLTKDNDGVWTFTTDYSVFPDVYAYEFSVNGTKVVDPKNHWVKENWPNGFANLFEIKSNENEFQQIKDVPHGKLEVVYYKSKSLGEIQRRMRVYLPPGYDTLKEKLPVLYLLHGGGDTDDGWSEMGRANFILDNLYSKGVAKKMIIVMPNGHTPSLGIKMGAGPSQDPYCTELLNDIMPFVEKNYKVKTGRNNTAIAGLSMGGIQTLNIALWNPNKFGYVFPMSTGYFPPIIKEIEENYSQILKNPELNMFKLFIVGMGKSDPLAYNNNKEMMSMLNKYGIKFTYRETEGSHTYPVWRRNLFFIADKLFK